MINKKMLTAFIVLLSLFLLASCGSGGKKETSASAFDYVINGTGNNSEVEIIELKNNSLKNIVIPTSIEGHLVTKISSNAFKDATKLKEITIPRSIKTIDLGAFNGANNLSKMTLPFVGKQKAASFFEEEFKFGYIFGDSSYQGSYQAGGYYIPTGLKEVVITDADFILREAFYGVEKLEKITLPDTLKIIAPYAFYEAKGIKELIIPASVTMIGQFAFSKMESLKKFKFEENSQLTTIEGGAFMQVRLLETVIIPAGVKTIGSFAFKDSYNITVYANANSKPAGWATEWDSSSIPLKVYWKDQWELDRKGNPKVK